MNCDFDKELLQAMARGSLADAGRERVLAHVDRCEDCRAALRGAEALAELSARDTGSPQPGLFDRVVDEAIARPARASRGNRFWAGAGVGALAASLVAIALFIGWTDDGVPDAGVPEFVVSLAEPRQMNLAFETDRALAGARITILVSGSVEIDGYGMQRELSWTENLDAGINRLSLPVIANGIGGGQMVVRMDHPQSEQVLFVRLRVES